MREAKGETTNGKSETNAMNTTLQNTPHGWMGLGTWKSSPGVTKDIVFEALASGLCRHIDSAPVYQNQREVGEAIELYVKEVNGGKREDVHVTSKLMTYSLPPEKFEEETERQLKELRIEKLDLMLLQWPVTTSGSIEAQWKALERLVRKGLVERIGVSNFSRKKLEQLLRCCEIKPSVNQIECHPNWRQDDLVEFCKENDIVVQCYGPLGSGDQFSSDGLNRKRSGAPPLSNHIVVELAEKYGATPAQICLNWAVFHRGTVPLPKTVNKERLRENKEALDIVISSEDLAKIDSIEEQYRLQHGSFHTGPTKEFKTLEELWDEDVSWAEGLDFEKPDGFKLRSSD